MRKGILVVIALLCLGAGVLHAERTVLRGTVKDDQGTPLAGAVVSVVETGLSARSGPDGRFELTADLPAAEARIRVTRTGSQPEERTVRLDGGTLDLEFALAALPALSETVSVTAPRLEVPLKENPAASSVVPAEVLATLPRAVAAEEALQPVPGVKVDNQANGERVHISIRGVGILTERGVRGILVLLDGIPLNDPSGFAPDLFDVDWSTVERVEVLRGPVAFLYGGGSAGGVINIVTRDGAARPIAADLRVTGGSNGFYKAFGEAAGSGKSLNYRVSFSRNAGDGYRDHTAFWANNLYGKMNWEAGGRFRLRVVAAETNFFNQNAEGLNLEWLAQDRRMANPDALTYNEYQQTHRQIVGAIAQVDLAEGHQLTATSFVRHTRYEESVPSSVQHRDLWNPGVLLEYAWRTGGGPVKNRFSAGVDLDGQSIDEYRHPNLGDAVEGPELVADQEIHQSRQGVYLMDQVELGPRWSLLAGLRHDRIHHRLVDNLKFDGLDLSGEATYQKTTGRVGVTYNVWKELDLFASWGQGFLPPATEELLANPDALGGFNRLLLPATSHGEEVGVRGAIPGRLLYDATFFHLDTQGDFERYRVPSRPLETFYANAGDSRRYGLELEGQWFPAEAVTVRAAYTYSHFLYTAYTSNNYPGDLVGNDLPNSPRHMVFAGAEWRFLPHWVLGVSADAQSRAFIDPTNQIWIDGYARLHTRLAYSWATPDWSVEAYFAARNLTGTEYIAFTEPDPDGNSYQPGPEQEFFGGVRVTF
jgi:iron complex outermembrane receptor protein